MTNTPSPARFPQARLPLAVVTQDSETADEWHKKCTCNQRVRICSQLYSFLVLSHFSLLQF